MKLGLALVIFYLLLQSCNTKGRIGKTEVSSMSTISVEDTFGNLKIVCTYLPITYLAEMESQKNNEPYDNLYKELKGSQYWELKLSDCDGSKEFLRIDNDPFKYQQRLNYLLKDLPRDIILIDGNDTLQLQDSHLERLYGVVPYNKILLTFKSKSEVETNDKVLIIKDDTAGGRPMRFEISTNNKKGKSKPQYKRKNS